MIILQTVEEFFCTFDLQSVICANFQGHIHVQQLFVSWHKNCITYFCWKRTTGSASTSLISTWRPRLNTSGCFFIMSQPTWEKKKPRLLLWGSASVSVYLWWTLWSRTQSKTEFYFSKNHILQYPSPLHYSSNNSITFPNYLSSNEITNDQDYTQWQFGFVCAMGPKTMSTSGHSKTRSTAQKTSLKK